MSGSGPKITKSIHGDCQFYKFDRFYNRFCCGGGTLAEVIEMIFCDGKSQSCKECMNCGKYVKKTYEIPEPPEQLQQGTK